MSENIDATNGESEQKKPEKGSVQRGEKHQMRVRSLDGKESEGSVWIRSLNFNERLVFGLKKLSIGIVLAIVFLPFPGVHFVMVPLSLVLGLVLFIYSWSNALRIDHGLASCPRCQSELKFKNLTYKQEFKDRCSSCLHELRFEIL